MTESSAKKLLYDFYVIPFLEWIWNIDVHLILRNQANARPDCLAAILSRTIVVLGS